MNGEQGKMQAALEKNSELIQQLTTSTADNAVIIAHVRDVLASFKIVASIAKWFTAMAILIASVIAAVKGIIGFNDITPR